MTDSTPTDLAPVGDLAERITYAKALAAASLLPDHYRGNPANVLLALEYGRSLGIEPITALNAIAVVKGKPTMSAELMRALVFRAGHRFRIVSSTPDACEIAVARHEHPADVSTFAYTIDDAKRAGLTTSDRYQKHPRAMLLARATSAACRAVFPDVIAGISYTPDELDDLPAAATVVERAPVLEDDVETVDAEVIELAPGDRYSPSGRGANAWNSEPATARQRQAVTAFAHSIGFESLDAFLASDTVRMILGGAPSDPLSKAHASRILQAARDFDATETAAYAARDGGRSIDPTLAEADAIRAERWSAERVDENGVDE
jgi:hypothetical protein